MTLKEAAVELRLVSAEQFDQWVRPERMVGKAPPAPVAAPRPARTVAKVPPRPARPAARTSRRRPVAARKRRRPCARSARRVHAPGLVPGLVLGRARRCLSTAQKTFRLSSRIVTGPRFTSATSIIARKTPVSTLSPEARSLATKCV